MMTRGIHNEVERWREHMSSQYFRYGAGFVQLAMRPIQFWEVVFPKEALPQVLKLINWPGKHREDLRWKIEFLRKRLKLDPIPEIDINTVQYDWPRIIADKNMISPQSFVAPIPIGLKEDGQWPDKQEPPDHPMKGMEQL